MGKDVWWESRTTKLLVGLAIVSRVFAESIIAVTISGGSIRVDRDKDGIGEGGVRQSRVESIAEDGKDGVRSDVGKLRKLGNLFGGRICCRHGVEDEEDSS